MGQIVHFNLESDLSLFKLVWGLNGILPPDLSVKNIYKVAPDFHARFSAVERVYKYLIYNYPQRSPFWQSKALWVDKPLDLNYLQKISQLLIGEHDFASFCKKSSSNESTVRRINDFKIEKKDHLVEFTISGTAFLHHMIRIIVGTMLQMHHQQDNPESIVNILGQQDRNSAGPTAAPRGLYLVEIKYDPPLDSYEKAI